jgi:pimeloyl-ACP methyl ester carboxylesterase
MKTYRHWIGAVVCALALALCASAQSSGALAGLDKALANVSIRHVDRTVLGEDVAHYRYEVVVGPGKFDRIGLHRIVRERHPWHPIHTVTGLLMLPGGPNTVEMIFMEPVISPAAAWDHAITVFLAKNNVDVWAMDYRWALVPSGTTDFNFMKHWGLQQDVDDAKIALSLARLIRRATGQGFGKMHLLGFSYGTWVAYPVVNQETQLPHPLRNVKGLIPVDAGVTFAAGEPTRDVFCSLLPQDQGRYAAGTYNNDYSGLKQIGDLGRSAPDDPSPFADGFTNYQFALLVGASVNWPPSWHFVAGVFNDSGITTGLQYTDPWLWIDVLRAAPAYSPVLADIDQEKVTCYDVVAPFDDHLAEVTLPILYVGAAGGWGERAYYAVTLTGSTDITKSIVQLHPNSEPELDFGHADLFTATSAETLVWQPILNWLVTHK